MSDTPLNMSDTPLALLLEFDHRVIRTQSQEAPPMHVRAGW